MIARWQEKEIVSALKSRRVVNLTGARQCGKTTLAGIVPLASARRFTLDDDETRKAAASDPYGFVERKDGETFVIDEIQKVPELLNAIKRRVDQDNARGQYLLTGSANLHFVKAVTDSLAGRIGRVRLRTLAFGELTIQQRACRFAAGMARATSPSSSSGRGVLPSSTMPRNPRPRTFRTANGTSRPTRHSCSSRARQRS